MEDILDEERKDRPYCKRCGRPLALNSTEEYCAACKDELLYQKVKEFVRTHDCTERDVADEFNISLDKIHHWIDEGYMTYKNNKRFFYDDGKK